MILSPMPEIISGNPALEALDKFLVRKQVQRVIIITGPRVRLIPGFQKILGAASGKNREVKIYDRTQEDPSFENVAEASHFANVFAAQAVIGIGGGSVLDTAKIVAATITNDIPISAMIGSDWIPAAAAPLVCFPTTAGTGSEVTNVAVLTDMSDGIKKAIVSNRLVPLFAGLLPELTISLPPGTTAATGMDALCHASEAFLSKRHNDYSDALALAALPLIAKNLPEVIRDPQNLEAREAMLRASLLAGLAFNNSSVTAIHAFAYPLGGHFHVAHGLANSLLFGAVMRHNYSAEPVRFAELARVFSGKADGNFIADVEALRENLPIAQRLRDLDIPESAVEEMADDVMSVTRLLSVNPREITRADAGKIYRESY
jgi:alcohol dehydrogenase class IV